jgi:hypothetical protein
MVPVDSVEVPRDSTYSGTLREALHFHLPDCHRLWSAIPCRSVSARFVTPMCKALQPRRGNLLGLGCSAFARRYLRNRFFFLFHQVLRCFNSLGWPHAPMYSVHVNSRISGSSLVYQLPQAFRRFPRSSSPLDTKTSPVRP